MNKLIKGFLDYKLLSQGKSEGTVLQYNGFLARLAIYLEGRKVPPLEATYEILEGFTGLYLHECGLKPRSRRGAVAAVRGFYAWLQSNGHIRENPAAVLPYPSAGRPLPYGMTLSNAELLLMAPNLTSFTGLRDAVMLALLMGCGLRVGGLVRLNQSDIRQSPTLDGQRTHMTLRVVEKGNRERDIPIPNDARALIMAYLGHEHLETIDRTLANGDKVLFVSTRNRRITPDKYHGEARRISTAAVRTMIIKYGMEAGIPRGELHPHAIRHLFGTELAENDVDLLIRQALMGHCNPKDTAIYTQLAMRKIRKAAIASNPLAKMQTPASDIAKQMERDGLW